MKALRRSPARWTLAASAGTVVVGLMLAVQPLGRRVTAAETPAGAPTTTVISEETTGAVSATEMPEPPTVATLVTTSPLAATPEGGMVPVDTEQAPLREMDETPPINIFADPEVAAKLLVDRKKFMYDSKGRPDPMVIPWVRLGIVNEELMAQAQTYIAEANQSTDPETRKTQYLLAIQELDRVIKTDPTSHQGKQAQALKDKVRTLIEDLAQKTSKKVTAVTKPPQLPPFVQANTRAVVLDESPKHNHLVLVGDDLLRVGDVVPKYDDVKIVEINRNVVIYEYKGVRVPVSVEVPMAR